MVKPATAQQKRDYERFAQENDRCWNCGWPFVVPRYRDWMIPRLVIAHILGGPARRHDVRDLCRLCDACHLLSHGNTIRLRGVVLPKITLPNLLWLKQQRDPEAWDLDYLNEIAIHALPEPEPPAAWTQN